MLKQMASLGLFIFLFSACSENSVKVKKRGQRSHPKEAIVESLPQTDDSAVDVEKPSELPYDWHERDLDKDGIVGISIQKARSQFQLKQSHEVIVAVLDSGVDINHHDLKGNIWKNTGEIPDNGIDDDENGFVDDVHGWNFLGSIDGKNIVEENLEETRIYRSFLAKLQRGVDLEPSEKELFKKVKNQVEKGLLENKSILREATLDARALDNYMREIKSKTNVEDINSRDEILSLNEDIVGTLKEALLELWDKYWLGFSGIRRSIENASYHINYGYNLDLAVREEVIGDDVSNFDDSSYGNNDVIGPDPQHGTHVAGIIAAMRNNKLGINGIASKVKIMPLRIVPKGDERDKDLALAIRYAVDNGADIINMSFGKSLSPHKFQVDEAIKYGTERGVLFVHAAGNESLNINGGQNHFPNSYRSDFIMASDFKSVWIEVSASTHELGMNLAAFFTNFGGEASSLFAPGEKIVSTIPNNEYASFSGTSMAAPMVSGVAAVLLSEYPNLEAKEIKAILESSVFIPESLIVLTPQNDRQIKLPTLFKSLSETGGVLNAFKALELTQKLF